MANGISNNRKRTRGRKIQTVRVSWLISTGDIVRGYNVVPNPDPRAGNMIQIKHRPIKH